VIAPWTKLARKGDKTYPRSFVFASIGNREYGMKLRDYDSEQILQIQEQMESRLCIRSAKYSSSTQAARKCKQKSELLKCISCSEVDGTWYSASSVTGAAFGRVDTESQIIYPNYNDGPFMHQQLDIAVPISGQDEKLEKFADRLGDSIRKFRAGLAGSKITIRLLVTRFQNEQFSSTGEMQAFRDKLKKSAALDRPGDSVLFVTVKASEFNRAKAANTLHREACHRDDCAVAVMDVDMHIASGFLRNAIMFAFAGASAYFPIMWSEYNPETVKLVEQFSPAIKKSSYSEHRVSAIELECTETLFAGG
jgi:hypothetical protein